MFGRLTLEGDVQQGMNIPTTALIKREQRAGVYIVGGDRAIFRWVKTGTTQNGSVEIVSGLSSGDRVVTSSLDRLQDGQLVNLSN
jgi:multidrug efflux pump subunit AcrA (membrane-fusion protein)